MKRPARWWLIFAACNLVVFAALVWTTKVVLALEQSERLARARSSHEEALRLALWRMDSWLSLLLARESAGHRMPGPEIDYVSLRFEIDSAGNATMWAADASGEERYRSLLRADAVRDAVTRADALVDVGLAGPESVAFDPEHWSESHPFVSKKLETRVACAVPRPPGEDAAGRQVVAWLGSPGGEGEPALVFVRRIGSGGEERFHGFVFDWPRLRERLLFEIRDLFPVATLDRVPPAAASSGALARGLANIPVALRAPVPSPETAPRVTSGRAALGLAWLAAVVAAAAVGATLHKSIDLGERRRRFVSAVTHELRTPLTTFRMYSEMLAEGVVPTEERRREYARTLKDEAHRLAAMVDNVLAHARLQDGRAPRTIEAMSLGELIERVGPPLERRAESSGMKLEIRTDCPRSASLAVDAESIGRILANLVDNAVKYGKGGASPTIHLGASTPNGSLVLTVRDHGPGVPREKTEVVFAPFDRGGRDPVDAVPGVGLGLALSRGLARDMGGDLTVEDPPGGGARFRLVLPNPAGRPGPPVDGVK